MCWKQPPPTSPLPLPPISMLLEKLSSYLIELTLNPNIKREDLCVANNQPLPPPPPPHSPISMLLEKLSSYLIELTLNPKIERDAG